MKVGVESRLSPPGREEHDRQVIQSYLSQPPANEKRWKLKTMKEQIPLFSNCSLSGIWRRLKALGVSWQRSRQYVHSPDQHYAPKVSHIMRTIAQANPHKDVILFADQLTYYNHASNSYDWRSIADQPLAHTAIGSTLQRRIAGLLDIQSGNLTFIHKAKTRVNNLIALYEKACERYPGKRLHIIVDNWPVHYHPDILACLEPQLNPFSYRLPKSWEKLEAKPKYVNRTEKLPIQLLSLPTYASWLNPIEKVWRRLKDQLIHLHPFAQDFAQLQQEVIAKLEQWEQGNDEMLRYCGLLGKNGLYSEARHAFLNATL